MVQDLSDDAGETIRWRRLMTGTDAYTYSDGFCAGSIPESVYCQLYWPICSTACSSWSQDEYREMIDALPAPNMPLSPTNWYDTAPSILNWISALEKHCACQQGRESKINSSVDALSVQVLGQGESRKSRLGTLLEHEIDGGVGTFWP